MEDLTGEGDPELPQTEGREEEEGKEEEGEGAREIEAVVVTPEMKEVLCNVLNIVLCSICIVRYCVCSDLSTVRPWGSLDAGHIQ